MGKKKYYNQKLMHPTKVYKYDGRWWCSYYMPYGGLMEGDHRTWREAFDDAFNAAAQARWG